MLPYARAALAAAEGARHAVEELTGLVRGRVRVGMAAALTTSGLVNGLADFRTAHPGVEITLTEGSADQLVDGLLGGTVDLAYVGLVRAPDAIASRIVTDQEVVAVGSGHDRVPVAALANLPLLAMPRGSGVRAAVDEACAVAGVAPRVVFEAGDPLVLVTLAAQGHGVAVVPESAVDAAGLREPTARLEPSVRARLHLAWRAGGPPSPAARALLGALR